MEATASLLGRQSIDISLRQSRRRGSRDEKGISLHIPAPVLADYKRIELKPHTSKRISHIFSNTQANPRSEGERTPEEWQQSVDRYIAARQQLHGRIASEQPEPQFQLLRLNRMNKHRRRRRVQEESLPKNVVEKHPYQETFTFDLAQTTFYRQHRHHNSQITQSQGRIKKPQRREYLLKSFISNYFKKKYQPFEDPKKRVRHQRRRLYTQFVPTPIY